MVYITIWCLEFDFYKITLVSSGLNLYSYVSSWVQFIDFTKFSSISYSFAINSCFVFPLVSCIRMPIDLTKFARASVLTQFWWIFAVDEFFRTVFSSFDDFCFPVVLSWVAGSIPLVVADVELVGSTLFGLLCSLFVLFRNVFAASAYDTWFLTWIVFMVLAS